MYNATSAVIFLKKKIQKEKDFIITFRSIEFRIVVFSTFQNVDNEAYITFIMKKNNENHTLSFYAQRNEEYQWDFVRT